jgi:hypothetical protein
MVQGLTPNTQPLDPSYNPWPAENRQWKTNWTVLKSHEEREVQTLVKRIEKQASQEAARDAETKRTLDDYRKTVGN